jgi:hypothetical protein
MVIKHIGVRELRGDLSRHVAGDEVIAVEKHGHLLGFSVPIRRPNEAERRELLDRADEAFQRLYAESGMSEDELAVIVDPSRPDPHA